MTTQRETPGLVFAQCCSRQTKRLVRHGDCVVFNPEDVPEWVGRKGTTYMARVYVHIEGRCPIGGQS